MRSVATFIFLIAGYGFLGTVGSTAVWGQGTPSSRQAGVQGMTAEEALREAQRLGIDLSNPEEALRQARALGIPEAKIQQWRRALQAGAASSGVSPSVPSNVRPQDQVRGTDAYRSGRQRTGADEEEVLGPPPPLAGLPAITPATLELTSKAEAVSVVVTLQSRFPSGTQGSPEPGVTEEDTMPSSTQWDPTLYPRQQNPTVGTWWDPLLNPRLGRTQEDPRQQNTSQDGRQRDARAGAQQRQAAAGAVPQHPFLQAGQDAARSDIVSMKLFFLSPTGTDTVVAERVQYLPAQGGQDMWLGTFLIPPSTPSGLWTLAVETVGQDGRKGKVDPAGILRIKSERSQELQYFGYSTFQNVPEAFQPGGLGPVGDNYVVGPQDELRLTVWGDAEFQYDLSVDPEGRIYVPRAGQLTVAGKRLDELRRDVRVWLSQSYAGLTGDPPSVFMDLTVTRLRPIQVFVLGEVEQPGGYTVPSGSSIFNALYSVGGPLPRGSLRNVQIIRGEQVATVDMYNYLLRGYDPKSIQLQTGDHVFIPPRGMTVTVQGAVRRPAIYELKEGEGIERLLAFAGGLTAEAYTKRFQIERIVPFEERRDPSAARTVIDLDLGDVLSGREAVTLADGDQVTVFSIPEASNLAARSRVPVAAVEGAVFKPGRYELNGEVRTVRDLIEKADGLTGDAYRNKAELIRLTPDLEREIISIDLDKVMADVPMHNLPLRPQDSLRVASLREMREERTVRIAGQVRRPGSYPYLEGMTVADLLFQGGGLRDPEFLKEVFLERADLFRRSPDGRADRLIRFDLSETLQGRGLAEEQLLPEDEIRVYAAEVEVLQDRFVVISGAVKYPGEYRYLGGMTVEDLILQAGGFEENAYRGEVEVTRALVGAGQRAEQLQVPLSSSFALASPAGVRETDNLAYNAPGQAPPAADPFVLQHRDRVYVRAIPDYKEQATVTVRGEVRYEGEYTLLHQNETLASVLQRAGGVLPTGYARGGRLLRYGEQVIVEMDRALRGDARANVILQPGDEIWIPTQPNTVAVRGNVANEGLLKYVPGQRVSYYLDRAGGLQDGSRRVLVTQASGATFQLRRPLFGLLSRPDPVVDDGAVIYVTGNPDEARRSNFDVSQTLRDTIALATSTVTLLVLIRQLNR